jgi:hypothetical protein
MNTNELVTKAIREGMEYSDQNTSVHRQHFQTEDVDRMVSTLSAGLIVLTEAELFDIISVAFKNGSHDEVLTDYEYASRIMREVKGGE